MNTSDILFGMLSESSPSQGPQAKDISPLPTDTDLGKYESPGASPGAADGGHHLFGNASSRSNCGVPSLFVSTSFNNPANDELVPLPATIQSTLLGVNGGTPTPINTPTKEVSFAASIPLSSLSSSLSSLKKRRSTEPYILDRSKRSKQDDAQEHAYDTQLPSPSAYRGSMTFRNTEESTMSQKLSDSGKKICKSMEALLKKSTKYESCAPLLEKVVVVSEDMSRMIFKHKEDKLINGLEKIEEPAAHTEHDTDVEKLAAVFSQVKQHISKQLDELLELFKDSK